MIRMAWYIMKENIIYFIKTIFLEILGEYELGNTVIRDLIQWEHLPLALIEEIDAKIFSGSAVVVLTSEPTFMLQ